MGTRENKCESGWSKEERDGGLGRGGRREGRRGEQNKTGEFIASFESLTYQKDPLSHWGKHLKNGD